MSTERWTPNDPLFSEQWNMEVIRAPEAWAIERGRPEVLIAMIERGFEFDHPDLRNKWVRPARWLSPDAPEMGEPGQQYYTAHGSHVSAIAAAETDNGVGVAGVAPGCKIIPIACDSWNETELARAIRYAADNGARVINMSAAHLSYEKLHPDQAPLPFRRNRHGIPETDELLGAVEYAEARGTLLCRGLTCNGMYNSYLYPGPYGNVIHVATTDKQGRRSDTSGYGDLLDLLAPSGWRCGVDPTTGLRQAALPEDAPPEAAYSETGPSYGVLSAGALHGGEYYQENGNCQSPPHVAGVAALVFSRHPDWSPVQIREVLLNTASGTGWNPYFGHGVLDAYEAVRVERFECELEIASAAISRRGDYFEVTATIANRGVQNAKRIPVVVFNTMPNEGHGVELGYRVVDVRGFEQTEVRIPIARAEDAAHPVIVVDLLRFRSARQVAEGTRYLFKDVDVARKAEPVLVGETHVVIDHEPP